MNNNYITTYVDASGSISQRKWIKKILIIIYSGVKFMFDRLFSLLGIAISLPIMIFIAIAIKKDSKGPVLFKQERTGKHGKPFILYKFRTMVEDNDVHDFSKRDEHTKVGKFLRKTSLDELPQLFNIFRADMSFIGPRPWITDYYKYMTETQRRRYDVRPGLTGLAQANGRNILNIFDKINYDLEYIKKYSFIQDIKIILLTIKAVFGCKGADAGKKVISNELDDLKKQNIRKQITNKKSVKYSFILPVYNVELYLEKCINSILDQQLTNYEIILVDDGSTDNCHAICDEYQKKDSRIKTIHQENGGISDARNTGLNNSKGKYILFVDPDDYIEKDYLKVIDKNISNCDMLVFSYNNLYKNKSIRSFGENGNISSTVAQQYLVEDNKYRAYVWNKVYKKSIIDKYNISFDSSVSMCEDVLFTYKYLLKAHKVKLIDDVLINYRQRKSSEISKKINNIDYKSLAKTYESIINTTNDEFVKIKSKALYLKNYYKYHKYIDDEKINMKLVDDIIHNDYKKISNHDKKIIIMYKYIPFFRTIAYKLKNLLYHKFD